MHPIARLCGAGRKGAVKEKGRKIQGKRGRNEKKGEGKETARKSTKTHIRFCAFVSHGPHVCAPVCAIPRVPVLRPCAFPSALRAKTVLSLCLRRAQAKGERRKGRKSAGKGRGKGLCGNFKKREHRRGTKRGVAQMRHASLRICCGRCFPARVQRKYPKNPLNPAPRRRKP